jgi:hypothetical protein
MTNLLSLLVQLMVGTMCENICVKIIVLSIASIFLFAGCCVQLNVTQPTQSGGAPLFETFDFEAPPQTRGWSGDEFIISYDEPGLFDAEMPDIAIAPPGTPWAGSVHSVWAEKNNSMDYPFVEIHYSKSEASQAGRAWSNDDISEGDRLISQDFTASSNANPGNAMTPSIEIDPMGWIHVIWVENYPDMTYEIHYSRSEDNGQTWTGFDQKATMGDILVTSRTGEDSLWINQPRMAITNSPLTIHVVWDEVSHNGDSTEIWYTKSNNQGGGWAQPVQISAANAPYGPGASEPDICTTGPSGETLHVVWTQDMEISPGIWCGEVFYMRSPNNGNSWEGERQISQVFPNTYAYRARVGAVGNSVFAVWNQFEGSSGTEVYYSGSMDGGISWSGEGMDCMVSFPDSHAAEVPVVSAYDGPSGQEVHVAWMERDETSPNGTQEIHYSMSANPMDPMSWTGKEHDNVLSQPDSVEFAEVEYLAMEIGLVGGEVRPQIVWEEKNVASFHGRVDRNNEIHYIPDMTFDIPVHLGWNLISVPLVQNNTNIETVLDDSHGDNSTIWDIVKYYSNTGTETIWKSHRASLPSGLNTLTDVNNKMGIWINITELGDGNLTVYGDYSANTQISLIAGWNLVGYPAQTSKSISDAFIGINDCPIEGYDFNSSYLISQLPGTYMMKPGEGYWVHVAADTVWTINW